MKTELINGAYAIAKERYAEFGIDTEKVIGSFRISISACIAGRLMT